MDSTRLCPKCGAYWKCDCVIEPPPERLRPSSVGPAQQRRSAIDSPETPVCQHDWSEVVGVELDDNAVMGEVQVLVCRHCGLYAVERSA
jgi:hypothetical protein